MSKAAELAALIGSQTALSNRNLIINGAMTVNQRGNVTGATGSTYGGPDRFYTIIGNGIGTWNITQDTDVPSGQGFANSWKLACTTADASPAAADHLGLHYRMEGQDLQQLSKGTSSAKSVTLSFWVKCNKTGNFQVSFYDSDNLRHIASTVTISSAATWQYVEITFAGDTTGAFNNDNGNSAFIEIFFDAGTDWTSGSVPTTWQSVTQANRAAGTNLALADSTSNYISITGIQLEVGETATPFEHRSYGDELARCQRYFFKTFRQQDAVGTSTSDGRVYFVFGISGTGAKGSHYSFPVTMRTNPTITIYDESGNTGQFAGGTTANVVTTGERGTNVYSSGAGGLEYYGHLVASAEL
jgi:hypothetical protein